MPAIFEVLETYASFRVGRRLALASILKSRAVWDVVSKMLKWRCESLSHQHGLRCDGSSEHLGECRDDHAGTIVSTCASIQYRSRKTMPSKLLLINSGPSSILILQEPAYSASPKPATPVTCFYDTFLF